MKKQIAIVHYNTPELTEACVLSIRKVGCDWSITIMDNSDNRPFTKKMKGVKVLNNRKGQLIDFDEELEKFPDRAVDLHTGNFASAKHMMSVQYLMDEVLKDGFVLMDSDILLKKPFEFVWDEQYAACGRLQSFKNVARKEKDRLAPMLLYLNVPLLKENGAKFFDPGRSWFLHEGGDKNQQNWYDTGAPLLEDIRNTKPQLVARLYQHLHYCYEHFGAASYRRNDLEEQMRWLNRYKTLWSTPKKA